MRLPFSKMQGLGNDFVVIDTTTGGVVPDAGTVRRLADRHTGIGFDQLLILDPPASNASAAAYRIFNASGTPAEQCGNGLRCLALYVAKRDGLQGEMLLDSPAGPVRTRPDGDGRVTVEMSVPAFEPGAIPFDAGRRARSYTLDLGGGESAQIGAVSLGNPHAVVCVDRVEDAPVARLGAAIGQHPRFPAGVNVGFVQIVDRGHLRLRVHERGVGETRACGTGACAAAVVCHERNSVDERVLIDLPGGRLMVSWEAEGQPVWLTGPAESVFEGHIDI